MIRRIYFGIRRIKGYFQTILFDKFHKSDLNVMSFWVYSFMCRMMLKREYLVTFKVDQTHIWCLKIYEVLECPLLKTTKFSQRSLPLKGFHIILLLSHYHNINEIFRISSIKRMDLIKKQFLFDEQTFCSFRFTLYMSHFVSLSFYMITSKQSLKGHL